MTLIEQYDGFVFDLDGTIYLGDDLLPGATEVVNAVRRAKKPVVYLTNKPLSPSSEYAAKLSRLGLPTDPLEVVSALDSLVHYLLLHHRDAVVFCVSEPLVAETLQASGFTVVGAAGAERASVVVVSFDRTFDYEKLDAAYRAVSAGAVIVATNPDRYCPIPGGGLPDCASMLAAVEACTASTAEAIVGKPSEQMMEAAFDRTGVGVGALLLVGDRIETDVAMARRAGIDAALVLSGATSLSQVSPDASGPTYVLDGIFEMLTEPPPRRRTQVQPEAGAGPTSPSIVRHCTPDIQNR